MANIFERIYIIHELIQWVSERVFHCRTFICNHRHILCALAITVALSIFAPQSLYSQRREVNLEIYFAQDSDIIDDTFMGNRESLERLTSLFELINTDSLTHLTRFEVNGYASPEPEVRYNIGLSARRVSAVREYIFGHLNVADSLVVIKGQGVAWAHLRSQVAASDMQYRDELLNILDNVAEESWRKVLPSDKFMTLVDSRQKHMMDLHGGRPYNYIYKHIFPSLRRCILTLTYESELMPIVQESAIKSICGTLETPTIQEKSTAQENPTTPEEQPQPTTPAKDKSALYCAIKTNLIYDALSLLNVEVEIPIGKRLSIAGEWIFPWWSSDDGTADSKRNRTQCLQGNIEAKYWFGNRANRALLTGWFAGIYAGGGLYDFERDAKGYQGEFIVAAGVSGGYAHTINRSGSLRMEYSAGFGYLSTDYRYYESEYYYGDWHAYRSYTGKFSWFGPTKLRASLVWMIGPRGVKKGGVSYD